jgi:hypothetical protein
MRNFKTGATRDKDDDKLDYEGFISPIVFEEYAKYMHENRIQADGKLRASDNWQKHFGDDHYAVCMKSMFRHFMDVWKEHRGYKSREGMSKALMGLMFNVIAYADKYYKDKYE